MKVYYAIEKTGRGFFLIKKVINYGFFSGSVILPVDSIPYATETAARNAAAMKGLTIAKTGSHYAII